MPRRTTSPRNGSKPSRATRQPAAQHAAQPDPAQPPPPSADAQPKSAPPPKACQCFRGISAFVALEIVGALGALPLPNVAQSTSPTNSLGFLVNRLRDHKDILASKLELIARLLQAQKADSTATPPSCAECDDLIKLLHAGCALAIAWDSAVDAIAEGLTEAANLSDRSSDIASEADQAKRLSTRLQSSLQRLAELQTRLPKVRSATLSFGSALEDLGPDILDLMGFALVNPQA